MRYLAAVHRNEDPAALESLRRELRIDRLLEDLGPLVDGMTEGAERVKEIVADLRQFSSGKKSEGKVFDLGHIVGTALRWVVKDAQPQPEVAVDLPPDLATVGHCGQIQQVVMNLIQNAVDALADCPGCKKIEIGGSHRRGQVEVWVRDNGPGLPEAVIDKIFEPFFTTKPVGQGTGLGLSISYGIVAEHGGSLQGANHPDGGAIFTLVLPAAEDT